MKATKLFGSILVICLCLLVVSTAYSKKPPKLEPVTYVCYHGYAMLCDTDPYMIVGDGAGPYVDYDLMGGDYGDKISVWLEYDPNSNTYSLWSFRCFMGKPELPWRSPRRVKLCADIETPGSDYSSNSTVADMLLQNKDGSARDLAKDGLVHFVIAKRWGNVSEYADKSWTTFLVDKSCEGEEVDPDAITQPSLWSLDEDAPRYWTSLEGSSFGSEGDPHGHIGFFMFEDQLKFTAIGHDDQNPDKAPMPITWEVVPTDPSAPVDIYVRKIRPQNIGRKPYPDDIKRVYPPFEEPPMEIWTLSGGLPFRLIMSRDIDFPIDGSSGAPPKYNTLTSTWGAIKTR